MSYIWWALLGLFVISIVGKLMSDVQAFHEGQEAEEARQKRIREMYGRDEE